MKFSMLKLTPLTLIVVIATLVLVGSAQTARADSGCSFTVVGTTMQLAGDCTTDSTIWIPDGFTLDGADYTITAVDPAGGHFIGAVIANAGGTAHVKNVTVTASGLKNACDAGANRLRGIMFEAASGSIAHNRVVGLNQGASGCQEGNAIEVRNAPYDGTHPNTVVVEIAHNEIVDFQKTGIVANGDVDVSVHHNIVGASATQENLAANSLQLGFGATGSARYNQLAGNQWMGTTPWAATAVLVYQTGVVEVSNNNIRGNADIGLYIYADNGTYHNNRIYDQGADHPNSDYDYGLGNWGANNQVSNNKVRGFEILYDGVVGGGNKAVPGGPVD